MIEHCPDACFNRSERWIRRPSKRKGRKGYMAVFCGQCGRWIGSLPPVYFENEKKKRRNRNARKPQDAELIET